jgi:predicted glycoside hydrolase/deacetylase ChbG (UPF0249 family)
MAGVAATGDIPRLIINADDFGLSEGINRGIMEAFDAGVLRSTSIMVGMPAFPDAVRRAGAAGKALGIGLHFALTAGRPLTPAPSLVISETGDFLSLSALIRRALLGRVNPREVADECAAQIARAREARLELTHLDGHHHVHVLPGIRDAVRRVVQAEAIPAIRRPRERLFGVPAWRRRLPERLLIRVLANDMNPERWRVRMTSHFVGSTLLGAPHFEAGLLRVLGWLPEGTTELMVHPGYVTGALPGADPYTTQREVELRALTSSAVRKRLSSGLVHLIHFGQLPNATA